MSSVSMPLLWATPVAACPTTRVGRDALVAPLVKVHVMRVQVVGNVAGLARPRLERLELVLGLRHVGRHVTEPAEVADAVAGIDVNGVVPLVHLDHAEHAVPARRLDQAQVVRQRLDGRLGDHHVQAPLDTGQRDVKVRVVRREHGHGVSRRKLLQRTPVRAAVHRAVGRESLARDVRVEVHVADLPLHVRADARQLVPVGAAEPDATHLCVCVCV